MNTRSLCISLVVKILSFFLIVGAAAFDFGPFSSMSSGPIFLIVMFAESTIFLSSASPFAVFSLVMANSLILTSQFMYIFVGYFVSLIGNIVSFLVGAQLCEVSTKRGPKWSTILMTYWHPQLASLLAFNIGLEGITLRRFLSIAAPVSLVYYSLAIFVIYWLGGTIKLIPSEWILLALVFIWIVRDFAVIFRIRRARLRAILKTHPNTKG
jgi:hypothetical protein